MSNEFNLERAKAGEPVVYPSGGPVKFIGISSSGYIVVEDSGGYFVAHEESELRMAPKKVKVRYRVGVVRRESGDLQPTLANDDWSETIISNHPGFVEWITDWQEAEVTE